MIVVPVRPEDVELVWKEAAPLLQKGMNEWPIATHELDDVLQAVMEKRFYLWVAIDEVEKRVVMAAVAELQQYPRCRTCHVVFLGGEKMRSWLRELQRQLMVWAKANGCVCVSGTGRRGWPRATGWQYHPAATMIGRVE